MVGHPRGTSQEGMGRALIAPSPPLNSEACFPRWGSFGLPPAGVVLTEGSLRALRKHPSNQNAPRGPDTLAEYARPDVGRADHTRSRSLL